MSPSPVWRRREGWSGGATFVVVMEAADVWDLNDRAAGWRLCSPRDGGILGQGEVRPPLVIIGQEASEGASKGPLIPHDDMIETLSPQGADQALDKRICQGERGAVTTSSVPKLSSRRPKSGP
jgi:hypothetical protein